MKECKTRYKVQKGKYVLYYIGTYALLLVNCWKISSTKTSHIRQTHTTNSELYTIRVIIYVKFKKRYSKNIMKVNASEFVGGGASALSMWADLVLLK